MEARARAFGRQVNFGFEKVERLPGNVGYLELRSFGFEAEWIGDAAAAAFAFLANTEALIVDVRRNGGGSPGMVAFVSSCLFGADSVHLNSLYWRPGNRTEHFYTGLVSRACATAPSGRCTCSPAGALSRVRRSSRTISRLSSGPSSSATRRAAAPIPVACSESPTTSASGCRQGGPSIPLPRRTGARGRATRRRGVVRSGPPDGAARRAARPARACDRFRTAASARRGDRGG